MRDNERDKETARWGLALALTCALIAVVGNCNRPAGGSGLRPPVLSTGRLEVTLRPEAPYGLEVEAEQGHARAWVSEVAEGGVTVEVGALPVRDGRVFGWCRVEHGERAVAGGAICAGKYCLMPVGTATFAGRREPSYIVPLGPLREGCVVAVSWKVDGTAKRYVVRYSVREAG